MSLCQGLLSKLDLGKLLCRACIGAILVLLKLIISLLLDRNIVHGFFI